METFERPRGPFGAAPVTPVAMPKALKWRDLVGLRHALVGLLTATVATAVAAAVATVLTSRAIDETATSTAIGPFGQAMEAVGVTSNLLGLYLLLYLGTGVVFVVWLYRATANARDLAWPPEHSPGWAIGGWFIPIAHLVIPFRIVRDLWRAGDAAPPSPQRLPLVWWLTYLVGGFVLSWAPRLAFGQVRLGSTTVTERADLVRAALERSDRWTAALGLIGSLLLAVSARSATRLVRGITDRQLEAARAAGLVPGTDPAEATTSRAHWWWAAFPVGAVALCLLVAVPLTSSAGSDVGLVAGGEWYDDPDGLYRLQTGTEWEPLGGLPTGTEAFAVGAPDRGFIPEVVLVSGRDITVTDAEDFLEQAESSMAEGVQVTDRGTVEGTGGELAYLDWQATDASGRVTRGHSVLAVDHGTWAIAELITPVATYDELRAEIGPYLHTLQVR